MTHDADLAVCDLKALGERTKMVAAITAPFKANTPPRGFGEGADICGVTALAPEFSSMAWARSASAFA